MEEHEPKRIAYGVINYAELVRECHFVDEYDNFTNELVVSGRDADYDAVCGHGGGPSANRSSRRSSSRSRRASPTAAQARRYRESLKTRLTWVSSVKTAVIEVCGSRGWNWFDVECAED